MASESDHIIHVKADLSEVEALVTKMQMPSVGRAVHYVSHGSPVRPDGTQAFTSQCRAADITEVSYGDRACTVPNGTVGLFVKNPTGVFFHSLADGGCDHDEDTKTGGSWHWPERV